MLAAHRDKCGTRLLVLPRQKLQSLKVQQKDRPEGRHVQKTATQALPAAAARSLRCRN